MKGNTTMRRGIDMGFTRRWAGGAAAVAALFAVALTSGCGGGGGGSSAPGGGGGGGNSGYAGHYAGAIQSSIDNATTTFTVNSSGAVSGTLQFSKLPSAVNMSGDMNAAGKITVNYTAGGHSYTVSGPLTENPLNAAQYSAILAVHDNTANQDDPNASMTVTRS